MMTGEAVPTGPSWMCATVPSMLAVLTVPEMAPLDMSIEKEALPVAKVVTAGDSCPPFSEVLLNVGGVPPPPSLPQEEMRREPHTAAASHAKPARIDTSDWG